jgi:hypothetical protein
MCAGLSDRWEGTDVEAGDDLGVVVVGRGSEHRHPFARTIAGSTASIGLRTTAAATLSYGVGSAFTMMSCAPASRARAHSRPAGWTRSDVPTARNSWQVAAASLARRWTCGSSDCPNATVAEPSRRSGRRRLRRASPRRLRRRCAHPPPRASARARGDHPAAQRVSPGAILALRGTSSGKATGARIRDALSPIPSAEGRVKR